MGEISPICHQDPRDNLWNNQKWQQTGGTKGSEHPQRTLSLWPLQHSPGVHQGTLRLKESLKYTCMSPSRRRSYTPSFQSVCWNIWQGCLFMVLDPEARLSQSGVPSGLESSVSLAVLSVLPERAGALGGGLDWRRLTQHRGGKLHNGPQSSP